MKRYVIFFAAVLLKASGIAQNPIVQNILNDVELDSMTFFVKQLTGEEQVIIGGVPDTIFSRHRDQPGNEKAFQFVKQKFAGYGLQVDSLQFSATGKNLLGIKTGTMFPNRKFILGAHYDNVGSIVAPGADDNASGSAAVLEAARIFSNYNFPVTIVFALWDEEEQGLIGSTAYASWAASNNDSILGYINMDMLGWDGNDDSLADLHIRPIANSLQLADKVIQANSAYSIGLGLHIVNPGTGATDHASFWNNGFTAIGINEEYDGDFNPFWHTPADSLGQFNIMFYQKCARLAYATLAECAVDSNTTLGFTELAVSDKMRVYPNPVDSYLNLVLPESLKSDVTILITDITGKIIYESPFVYQPVSVENLQSGIYFLTAFSKEFNQTQKFVINK